MKQYYQGEDIPFSIPFFGEFQNAGSFSEFSEIKAYAYTDGCVIQKFSTIDTPEFDKLTLNNNELNGIIKSEYSSLFSAGALIIKIFGIKQNSQLRNDIGKKTIGSIRKSFIKIELVPPPPPVPFIVAVDSSILSVLTINNIAGLLVNWGDGNTETIVGNSVTHIFATSGLFDVKLYGIENIPAYFLQTQTLVKKIISNIIIPLIGTQAFDGCQNITDFIGELDVPNLPDGDNLHQKATFSNTFAAGSQVELNFTSENFTRIGMYSFYASKIKKIRFNPNAVFSIGSFAFYNCTELEEVILGKVTEIGNSLQLPYAFTYCSKIKKFEIDLSMIVSIPDGYSDFGPVAGAFASAFASGSNIELNFTSPNLTKIGSQAFMSSKIWKVHFSNNANFTIGFAAFAWCSELVELNLGSVITIGANAFLGCSSITTIIGDFSNIKVIEDGYNIAGYQRGIFGDAFAPGSQIELHFTNAGFTKLGTMAFRASKIWKVHFNQSASFTIGFQAFYNCTELIYIDLGGATLIDTSALTGCSALQVLRIGNPNPPTLNSTITTTSLQKISVPAASVSAYQNATGWVAYANLIVGDY